MHGFLFPYYREQATESVSVESLVQQNDLRSIEDSLRHNGKIHSFANRNDFLTTDEDLEWITSVLGPSRAKLYAEGGHLGNLHKPEVRSEVMAAIEDLLRP